MDGIEKRPAVKALIEKGKAAGKLTTQEIDTVIVDMDLDIEDLDKLYETIEAQNIEIIDDLSTLDVDDVNFDLGETTQVYRRHRGSHRRQEHHYRRPRQGLSQGDRQGSAAHSRGGDRARYQNRRQRPRRKAQTDRGQPQARCQHSKALRRQRYAVPRPYSGGQPRTYQGR